MAPETDTGRPTAEQIAASPVRIRPELHPLAVPIDQVTPWPNNPRIGDEDTLRASLTEHGQYLALLIQESSGYIIKGNNTLKVMRELGATHVAAQVIDVDDVTAAKILAIDNRSSDKADYERRLMAELLSGLPDLDGTGWDADELDDLLVELGDAGEQLDTIPADLAPPVFDAPPATDATYAETPEEEAARAAARATQTPQYAKGLAEMILVLPEDDRAEAVRTIGDIRGWLGADLKTGEVVLRALRTLAAVGDARHNPDQKIDVGMLLAAASYTGASDD
jgi:ParB-like chromosome segregation protein Spo0J